MKLQRKTTVWEAIEASPSEALNMKARAEIMHQVRAVVDGWKLTQLAAGRRLGLTQPRMNDLLRGRINKFSVDALMKIAQSAGLSISLQVTRRAA